MKYLIAVLCIAASAVSTIPAKWYIATAPTVSVDLSKVTPYPLTPAGVSFYLTDVSCLSYAGPLGSVGPLSVYGPIGDNSWNPSAWFFGNWSDWAQKMAGMGGPLSADGPLGHTGPMTQYQMYTVMPSMSDFNHHMLPAGLWTVLGPLGPLGPMGALGPLGPIGAHGYARDTNGNYVDKLGKVMRRVTVPYDDTTARTFELFEKYTQAYANKFVSQDTSFMVEATYSSYDVSKNLYPFLSDYNQVVTIVLVPTYTLDYYSLTILDRNAKVVATTYNFDTYVPWIQVKVQPAELLYVQVNLKYHGHILSPTYRLFVVGSTSEFVTTDITGPHILPRLV